MAALSQQFKRYTYPYDSPAALSGGMGMLPSSSLSQPGGAVAAPRTRPALGGMGAMSAPRTSTSMPGGMGASAGTGWNAAALASQAMGVPQAATQPSPYEAEYRGAARGWEEQRGQLAEAAQQRLDPQAWASAGLPATVWKATLDKQLASLDDETEGARAQIDAAWRAGHINSAERQAKLEALTRDYNKRRAQAIADIETQKRTEGREAALAQADRLLGLYGQTPVAPEPSATPLAQFSAPQARMIGGGSRARDNTSSIMALEAWAQKNPQAANALARRYGGKERW